jgi:hypothetical protein
VLDEPIRAALNKDIATGEKIEAKLDAFIRKRHKEGRHSKREQPEEEAWKESVRRHEAARVAHLRQECARYYTAQPSVTGPLSKLSWHITRLRPRSIYRSFNPPIPESVSATTEV